jgi:biotin operon repressor
MSTEPSALPSESAQPLPGSEAAIVRPPCEWCGEPLTSRQQKRFHGKRCSNPWYELHRPRQASAVVGAPREGSIKAIILGLLHDGAWHSLSALAAAAKCSDASASARVRELRAQGFRAESDLELGNVTRQHRYRLVRPEAATGPDGMGNRPAPDHPTYKPGGEKLNG